MTNAALVALYGWVFWPCLVWALGFAMARRDWCVIRAVALAVAGQVFIGALGIKGDDFLSYAFMFGLTAFLAVIRPAGVFLGVFGAVNIAGFILALIGTLKSWTHATDTLIWQGMLAVSVVELLVIVGGNCGGIARSIRDYLRRTPRGIPLAAGAGSVAR